MSRLLFPCLALVAFVPNTASRSAANPALLKNPVEIRVTAVAGDSVPFRVETRGGLLLRSTADGRWVGVSGGTTPDHFHAFPQGPGLLFVADNRRPLRIEAWRMSGNTRRASAVGSALVVRATGPAGPAEVAPAPTTTSQAARPN